jgi:hypothetical protein
MGEEWNDRRGYGDRNGKNEEKKAHNGNAAIGGKMKKKRKPSSPTVNQTRFRLEF